MNTILEIEKRILKNKKEIIACEQEIIVFEKKIAASEGSIQTLKDVLKLLTKDNNNEGDAFKLREGSLMHKTSLLLKKSGKPLHVTKIMDNIGIENTVKNKNSISTSLANYARRGVIFTKPHPNTYGLIEFNQAADDIDTALPENSV